MRYKLFLLIILSLFSLRSFAQEVLSGDITGNIALTADKTYLLSGYVRVKSGGVLTIESGTVIYGENSSSGTLIIQPGGKIMAEGTGANPIVFTSEFSKPGSTRTPTYGDWGGIILLGNAPINPAGGTAQIEGPADVYGGTDPNDNSGVMKYVRIEYPGIALSPNNEINGLTFGGVGRGTIIDFIQVSYSGDDSYEWFGGTVNCKHLIAYRGWDDDFDTDFGFQGKLQFLVAVRDPQIADQSQSNGFESDNDGSGSLNIPRTSPTWWNVTLIGPQAETGSPFNSLFRRGMHLRRSSQNKMNNALIMGWPRGIVVDGKNTVADASAGNMYVKNSIVSGSSVLAADSANSDGAFDPMGWFTAETSGNRSYSDNSPIMLNSPFDLNNPDFMPKAGSPALTGAGTPPNDGFFDTSAVYIGAFGSADWTEGWVRYSSIPSSGVSETAGKSIPSSFELSQNYPNPFNPSTKINYALPEGANVSLKIYNVLGQQVADLVNGFRQAGNYQVNWNAENLTAGIYIYRLEAGSNITSRKMTLLK